MWTRHHKQRRTGMLIVPAITAAFLAYFGYHAFHGDYGIYAKYRLDERVEALTAELETLTTQRSELETRMALLSDGSIERDMLDERTRDTLDMVRANEVVVRLPID